MLAKLASRTWWGAVLLVCGCQDGAPVRFAAVEGGICAAASQPRCSGADSLLMCVDREWTEMDCADICAIDGYFPSTEGCIVRELDDWCACKTTDDACADITRSCVSEASIEACVDGAPSVVDCADVCAELDPPRSSLGCNDTGWLADCSCTLGETSCDDAAPRRCDDLETLASCVDGVWVIEPCADGCGPDQVGYCSTSVTDDDVLASCTCV
jgi:hypothetical protein